MSRVQKNLQVWTSSDFIIVFKKNIQDRETYVQSLRADLEDREARLRAQEEEMKERDAEINRLLGELRRCQTQLLGPQVQNDNTVEPPLNGHPSIKVT